MVTIRRLFVNHSSSATPPPLLLGLSMVMDSCTAAALITSLLLMQWLQGVFVFGSLLSLAPFSSRRPIAPVPAVHVCTRLRLPFASSQLVSNIR